MLNRKKFELLPITTKPIFAAHIANAIHAALHPLHADAQEKRVVSIQKLLNMVLCL